MRNLFVLGLVALAVIFLPSVASAGNGTGACYSFGGPVSALIPAGEEGFSAACLDDLTPEECSFALGPESEWSSATTCDNLKVPWDGSCLFDFQGTIGLDCIYLYYEDEPNFAQLICEGKAGGQFFDDPAACGVPTPTMPGFGMAALALLMLGGALVLLTMKGSAKTA